MKSSTSFRIAKSLFLFLVDLHTWSADIEAWRQIGRKMRRRRRHDSMSKNWTQIHFLEKPRQIKPETLHSATIDVERKRKKFFL